MNNKDYTERYGKKNPYTEKKPCVNCGSTDRYALPPYQCKVCQRKRAIERHHTIALMD